MDMSTEEVEPRNRHRYPHDDPKVYNAYTGSTRYIFPTIRASQIKLPISEASS
jgi:hypothetical protein